MARAERIVSAPLLRETTPGMQITQAFGMGRNATQVSAWAKPKTGAFGNGEDETMLSAAPMTTPRYFSKKFKTRARIRIKI